MIKSLESANNSYHPSSFSPLTSPILKQNFIFRQESSHDTPQDSPSQRISSFVGDGSSIQKKKRDFHLKLIVGSSQQTQSNLSCKLSTTNHNYFSTKSPISEIRKTSNPNQVSIIANLSHRFSNQSTNSPQIIRLPPKNSKLMSELKQNGSLLQPFNISQTNSPTPKEDLRKSPRKTQLFNLLEKMRTIQKPTPSLLSPQQVKMNSVSLIEKICFQEEVIKTPNHYKQNTRSFQNAVSSNKLNEINSPCDLYQIHTNQKQKEIGNEYSFQKSTQLPSPQLSSSQNTNRIEGFIRLNSLEKWSNNLEFQKEGGSSSPQTPLPKSSFNPSKLIQSTYNINDFKKQQTLPSQSQSHSYSQDLNKSASLQFQQSKEKRLNLEKLKKAQNNLQKLNITKRKLISPIHRNKFLFESMESKLNSQFGEISQKIAFNLDYIKEYYKSNQKTFKVIKKLIQNGNESLKSIFIKNGLKEEINYNVVTIENLILNELLNRQNNNHNYLMTGANDADSHEQQLLHQLELFFEQLEVICIRKMKSKVFRVFESIKQNESQVDNKIEHLQRKQVIIPDTITNRKYSYQSLPIDYFTERLSFSQDKLGRFNLISQESQMMSIEIEKQVCELQKIDRDFNNPYSASSQLKK